MKRQFIAGVMGLALAGCAHSRSEVARNPDGTSPVGPVGLKPVPSIHETINRGTGNAALAQSALRDPNNPRWTGLAPSPGANPSGAPGGAPPPQAPQPPQMAASDAASEQPNVSRNPQAQPPGPPERSTAQPGPSSLAGNPPAEAPDRLAEGPVPTNPPAGQPAESPDRLNPAPALDAAASAAAATMPAMAGVAASPGDPPTGNATPPPTSTAAAQTASIPQGNSPTVPGGPSPASSVPYTLERPGGPMPDMLNRPGGTTADPSSPTPDLVGAGGASLDGPPGSEPVGTKVTGPAVIGLEPVGAPPMETPAAAPPMQAASAPTDAAVSPSGGQPGATRGAAARKPKTGGDPLLGPNPDLMPELPPLPATGPAATPAAATPSRTSSKSGPASAPATAPAAGANDLPPLGPATGPADAPTGPAPSNRADAPAPPPSPEPTPGGPSAPPELGPPSADNRPGGVGPSVVEARVADLPPLEPVPSASRVSDGTVQQAVASTDAPKPARRASARRDGQIVRTSLKKPESGSQEPEIPASWRQATMMAAKVGDEIITVRDLTSTLAEHCKRRNIPYASFPRDQKNEFCAGVMNEMINQSLLIQEAKRTIKNSKMYDQFTGEADRYWREDQLPQLEVEFAAENEQQLREKLKEHGRSIETISLMAKRGWMADAFLHAKLKDRVKVDLPDLRKYYFEHLRDREFDRPAQINWREIVVEAGPQTTREQARRKIEAIHQSLRRGADFAALASAQSEGPSRSREQGGLMQTSPGSYGVASVNEALETLPIGRISPILEGPSSFHIVRVESRRAAGPAPFEELYDQIRSTLLEKKYQAERAAYIQKLRDESFVSTFLDEQDSNPRRASR